MGPFRKFIAAALLAALAVGVVAGCGQLPTSPATDQSVSATQVQRVATSDGLLGDLGSIVTGLVKLVFKVLNLVGSIGGSLTNGRWRVDIPAGAVDGNATVSLGVASSTAPECQLEISPADKNHFSTPAVLTVSCSGVSDYTLRGYVILWYNPATGTWSKVDGSKVDLTKKTVSAPLQHFSIYKVGEDPGKAGW